MSVAPAVLVVGDIGTDVVARLAEPVAAGSDTTAEIRSCGGGSGANVAAWLAAVGVPVAFLGRVGADAAGSERASELAELGVQARLAVDPQRPTGTVIVLVGPDGERSMLPDRGANLHLSPSELPRELFAPRRHLHLSGYTLLDSRPRAAGLHALALAREVGMTVSVDPSSVQPLLATGPRHFLEWTRGVDVCLPNLAEASALSGMPDAEQAARGLTGFYREVVVTLGPDGALWSDGSALLRVPAETARVRDSTGAGDAFTAGFLAARLQRRPPAECLAGGTQLAAAAVARIGARPPAAGDPALS